MVAAPLPLSLVPGATPSAATSETHTHAWKNGSFGFHDVLDLLNPLQHIPIVSSVYRWLTDDIPGNVSRILGDGLFGGPIGLVTGALSVAVKEETGKDPGEMAISLVTGSDTPSPKVAAVTAAAAPAPDASPSPTTPGAAADGAKATPAAHAAAPPMLPLRPSLSPLSPPISAGEKSPEAAFLAQTAAQNAVLQRSLAGEHAAARPITAPIPLQLTGSGLPLAPHRPAVITPAPAAPENPPREISQRMLEALDKYMQLRQQRGSTIDLVQ